MTQAQKNTMYWIILLAIIAAAILLIFPQYKDFSKTIQISLMRNIASNLTAATAANYQIRKISTNKGMAILNCQDVARLQENRLPSGYHIVDQKIPVDKVVFCTLVGPNSEIQFSAIGIK